MKIRTYVTQRGHNFKGSVKADLGEQEYPENPRIRERHRFDGKEYEGVIAPVFLPNVPLVTINGIKPDVKEPAVYVVEV